MNDILGGGGFTSQSMNRVRSDEGLAYDAHTSFPRGVYYPLTFSRFPVQYRERFLGGSIVFGRMEKMINPGRTRN